MKSSVIPQVRVELELREKLDAVLREHETLSEFVTDAVRRAVEQRRVETDFQARGEAAWARFQQDGAAAPADEVIERLQRKLDAKRKQLRSA